MTTILLALLLAQAGDGAAVVSGTLEPRPSTFHASPLQNRVDAAAPGAVIEVGPGTYAGDLFVDRPVRLVGHGRPLLVGSGTGSVVLVRAPGVIVEGFDIDGVQGGDLGRDSSGIHIAAPRVTIRDCTIRDAIFGIYLYAATGARIERCRIRGIRGKSAGEKGSGIHVWNTDGFELTGNDIADVRDGFYIQSSPHGVVRGNVARDLRYGLHYMYSDDNLFEDNVFENGDAGTAIMYSRRLTFRHNQFLRNRGFASVGLLLKTCDDVLAERNLIADNARGIFLEEVHGGVVRDNLVAQSDVGIVLFDSSSGIGFRGNSFVGNMAPLSLNGRRTDAVFHGNYWSDNGAPDLDGDGVTDRPYRLSSLFDHFRGNLTAADLMSRSLAASAVAAAEQALPVLEATQVADDAPLARPPALSVPASWRDPARMRAPVGLLTSSGLLAAGAALLTRGNRRRSRRRRAERALA